MSTLSHSERLDRLPFTRLHGKLLVGSGVGWAMDAMDVGLISFVVVQVRQAWSLSSQQVGWIASAGFLGMMIGASVGGLLADRVGRRNVFALTLLVYGLATGASALAGSVAVLIGLRILVGLGLGAELPIASTLVSEFAPARIRGRVIVALEAFWALGWTLAALIGYFVVPLDNGWRWALAIGAVPTAYALVVRHGLPESVRFLDLHGRQDAAEAVVQRFEAAAGVTPPAVPVDEAVLQAAPGGVPARLWQAGIRGRAVAIGLIWFCVNFSYYGAFTWLPSLLVADGISVTSSLKYTLIITLAQLPGYACAALTIEKWGRRATLAAFLAGSALAAGLFALAVVPGAIIAAGMALSFFNLGAWGALYAATPELFPTSVRGSGAGWAAAFGRVASIIAPSLVPVLLGSMGRGGLFVVFAVGFIAAAGISLALPELRGTALVDQAEPEGAGLAEGPAAGEVPAVAAGARF